MGRPWWGKGKIQHPKKEGQEEKSASCLLGRRQQPRSVTGAAVLLCPSVGCPCCLPMPLQHRSYGCETSERRKWLEGLDRRPLTFLDLCPLTRLAGLTLAEGAPWTPCASRQRTSWLVYNQQLDLENRRSQRPDSYFLYCAGNINQPPLRTNQPLVETVGLLSSPLNKWRQVLDRHALAVTPRTTTVFCNWDHK